MRDMGEIEVETVWVRNQRRRRAARFLKGPIKLDPLHRAAQLPGKALALYLAIRHRADLRRSPEVTLPADYLATWGIRKDAKSRALAVLEGAGLVQVTGCQSGRSVRVRATRPPPR